MKSPLTLLLWIFSAILVFGQPDIKALDKYCEKALQDWQVAGMSIGIIKDGHVDLLKGYGVLEAGKPAKADDQTLYAIASNTKAFIATSLAMLVDEGKLSWDDPVQKYLPYFKLYDPYVSAHATIRDLLSHRIGLGTFSGDVIWYKSDYTAEEVVKRAAELPQAFEFRAGYGYSNIMFLAAGEVIKVVSGKPWDIFVKERILNPLGMAHTITSVEKLEGLPDVATPHKAIGDKNEPIPWVNWDNMGAAGGIISNASDMLKWLQFQANQGKVGNEQLVTSKTMWDMWQPNSILRISENSKKLLPTRHFSTYSMGWGLIDYNGYMVVSHSGGYDGMYSRTFFVPELKLGCVILTNSMRGIASPLMYRILDAYTTGIQKDWSKDLLDAQKENGDFHAQEVENRKKARVMGTHPSLDLEKYAGLYRSKLYGDIRISRDGADGLKIDFVPAPGLSATLTHWHFDTFEINWKEPQAWFDFGTVQFILDNSANVKELQFDVPNGDIFFEEIKAVKTAE